MIENRNCILDRAMMPWGRGALAALALLLGCGGGAGVTSGTPSVGERIDSGEVVSALLLACATARCALRWARSSEVLVALLSSGS